MTARLISPRALATRWRAALAGLAAGVAIVSCHDALGPHGAGLAPLAVAPLLPSDAAIAEFGLTIDRVRIVVVRPPGDTIADTAAAFPADQDVLDLSLRVPLVAARESLSVTIEALAGTVPLFRGTQMVEVRTGLTPPAPVEIPVTTYVGPGAGVDSIAVQPSAPFIYLNDSLRFQVQAFQGGAPVTQFYVSWSSSDSALADINGFGVMRAPAVRGGLYVRARTPSGASDSVPVTFVPLPTQLVITGGDGQTGIVSQTLEVPLEVEVRGSDNLPVGGVSVRFRALSGGGPADTTVTSDAAGRARVPGVLGPLAGTQGFEASLPAFSGIAPVTFSATAVAGAVATVTALPAADTLHSLLDTTRFVAQAEDEFGNAITDATFFWTSGDTVVAKVSQTGLATALANGLAQIVATSGGVADTAFLTVEQVVASVAVTPDRVLLTLIGETVQLAAEALDSGGSTVAGVTFTWVTSDSLVATVDATGLVTALADGTTGISATTAGVSGVSNVTVNLLGAATRLVFIQQPPSPVFFNDTFTVQVEAQDDAGNRVTSFSNNVTLWEDTVASTDPGARLQGTLTQTAVNGVATFSGLFVDGTDTTAIEAVADALVPDTSVTFHVVELIVLQGTGPVPYFAGVDTVTNRIYVSNRDGKDGGTATVLDGGTPKVANTVIGLGPNPGWEGVNPTTKRVFISDSVEGTLYIIDEGLDAVLDKIAVGANPTQPAVNWRDDTVYLPAQGTDGLSLVIIDMSQPKVVGEVLIGTRSDIARGAVWDPATGLVWVAVENLGIVTSVDPVGLKTVNTITVGEGPYGVALDSKANRLYVSLSTQNAVAVIDLVEGVSLQPISVGAFPQGLSVDAESGRVFVANRDEGTISVIDVVRATNTTIAVGRGPGDAEYNPRNRLVYVPNGSDNSISIVKP